MQPPDKSICVFYIFLVFSHLDLRDSKIVLQVKSLQGKLLILISDILDCNRENALNITASSLLN